MSDDISIPSPTYRVPRHSGGMDPGTRKLAMIAAAIGGGLLVVAGGWSMISHRSGSVPVVQAESGPMKVKPANPGGLQVAGAGNEIFSGGSDTDVEKLAPPPETPDPQALRAPPAQPAIAAAQPAVAAAQPAVAAAQPAVAPAAALPGAASGASQPTVAAGAGIPSPPPAAGAAARAPETAASAVARTSEPAGGHSATIAHPAVAAAALPSAAVAGSAGRSAERPAAAGSAAEHGRSAQVQLAALPSEQAARVEWEHMVRRWPELFGGHQPAFSKIEHGGQVFWRLRTGGFEGFSQAATFCERLRAKGGGCSVADF